MTTLLQLPYPEVHAFEDIQTNFEAIENVLPTVPLATPTGATQPTITVGTARQPNTSRAVQVILSFAFTIVGAQSEAYTVKIGAASPPTLQIGSPQITNSAAGATITNSLNVTFMLPVGWWYEVNQVTHTGAMIITATELVC